MAVEAGIHIEEQYRGETPQQQFLQDIISPWVSNSWVMDAFVTVDRATFAPDDKKDLAYTDEIVPLENATISQPSLVAKMMNMLEPSGVGKVLEVGTASGYGAALLSRCYSEVHTVEISQTLAEEAEQRLRDLGYTNVFVHTSDGALGLPGDGPFDSIIFTASVRSIPQTIIRQLKEGGRIVLPVGPEHYEDSYLILGEKRDGILYARRIGHVYFMPVMSEQDGGWTEETLKAAEEKARIEEELLDEKKVEYLANTTSTTTDAIRTEYREKLREDHGELSRQQLNRAIVTIYEMHNIDLHPDHHVKEETQNTEE